MVKIHFLSVGSGDCTIVHFPPREIRDASGKLIKEKQERIMMVDLYHHEAHWEYEHIIDYYKQNFKDQNGNPKPIFRFVCSHPHQDHICGLAKLFYANQISISNFWDLEHSFEPENFDNHETHEEDWSAYQKHRDPSMEWPRTIITTREDTPCDFWHDGEDRITVLAPSKQLIHQAHYTEDGKKKEAVEIDEMSYALMIKINNIKVILAGDGQERTWNDIYDNCKNEIMNCHILKAGHHGQESGFHEDAVKLMTPDHIIFSNSKKEDKNHGAETLYAKAAPNAIIYKTCDHGTIIAECGWKGGIQFYKK